MKEYIEKLRRATWTYKQPLTQIPNTVGATVSDLFIWRNSSEWETFFELINLPAIFSGGDGAKSNVTLIFFDAFGQVLFEKVIQISPDRRKTLVLSKIIGKDHGLVGTFSVFHADTPQSLKSLGCHLVERGYVGYRYRGAPLRSYVHGNLDAVARLSNKNIQLLGGQSFCNREYILQHPLIRQDVYELAIVNPTWKKQKVLCRNLSAKDKLISLQSANLAPCGSHIFRVTPVDNDQRIIMSSRMIMARPLVFHIRSKKIDVFHG